MTWTVSLKDDSTGSFGEAWRLEMMDGITHVGEATFLPCWPRIRVWPAAARSHAPDPADSATRRPHAAGRREVGIGALEAMPVGLGASTSTSGMQ